MKALRTIRRSRPGKALLTLELPIATLHEIEFHARLAGLDLGAYILRACQAGDRDCEHGISIMAKGAAACSRCVLERREVAQAAVQTASWHRLRSQAEGPHAPEPVDVGPEIWNNPTEETEK